MPTTARHQLRIQGGKWRGRNIHFPDQSAIRPTPNRVRETLFNWLRPIIHEARCLDLFAGSGILGLEALSQGAKFVQFVDRDHSACQHIEEHLQLLHATENTAVTQGDAAKWLISANKSLPFDIIFMDPPFAENQLVAYSQLIKENNLLKKTAYLYMESNQPIALACDWKLHRQAKAGSVIFGLWQLNDD